MYSVHTILHPTDFSSGSAFAFQIACALAKNYDARLILLHVMAPASGSVAKESPPELLEKRFSWPKPSDPTLVAEHRVAEGYAPEEILRVAGAVKCDLIVMGTHGRTGLRQLLADNVVGLRRLLTGSVAEEVLRQAACPVLAAKLPLPDAPLVEASQDASETKGPKFDHHPQKEVMP